MKIKKQIINKLNYDLWGFTIAKKSRIHINNSIKTLNNIKNYKKINLTKTKKKILKKYISLLFWKQNKIKYYIPNKYLYSSKKFRKIYIQKNFNYWKLKKNQKKIKKNRLKKIDYYKKTIFFSTNFFLEKRSFLLKKRFWFSRKKWKYRTLKLKNNLDIFNNQYIFFPIKSIIIIKYWLQIKKWPLIDLLNLERKNNFLKKRKKNHENIYWYKKKRNKIRNLLILGKYHFTKNIQKYINYKLKNIKRKNSFFKFNKTKNKQNKNLTLNKNWKNFEKLNFLFFKKFYLLKNKKEINKLLNNYQQKKFSLNRNFIFHLESKLIIFLFRTNLFNSLYFIKQIIKHKYIFINNKINTNENYRLKINDIVYISTRSIKQKYKWLNNMILNKIYVNDCILNYPKYIEINYKLLMGVFVRKPYLEEIIFFNNLKASFSKNFFI